jgi:hypothetical protein
MSEEQPGYAERDQDPTTEQTGGDPEVLEEEEAAGTRGADSGGRAHTSPQEGHPAGEGPRSDREVGGPTPEEGGS